jgi:hypothetical protein
MYWVVKKKQGVHSTDRNIAGYGNVIKVWAARQPSMCVWICAKGPNQFRYEENDADLLTSAMTCLMSSSDGCSDSRAVMIARMMSRKRISLVDVKRALTYPLSAHAWIAPRCLAH